MEVPIFKENALICVITEIKIRELLLTLLQIKQYFDILSKMNEHRLLTLINTSYMIVAQ